MSKLSNRIMLILRVLVPVVLLTIIFTRVDIRQVLGQVLDLRLGYFAASLIVGYWFQISGGAWRWKYFLKSVYSIDIPYSWILKEYWKGMFLGYFVPGQIGWDAYRLVMINRRFRAPLVHVTVLFLEKIIGLISSVILIMASYPFVSSIMADAGRIKDYMASIYVFALIIIPVAVIFLSMKKTAAALIRNLESGIIRMASRYFRSFQTDKEHSVFLQGLTACYNPRTAFFLWGSSILIRSCSAIGGYLVLRALHIDNTSVMINFFAIPTLFLLSMLPISFGSIGIREVTFIVVYGLFGIPPVTALSASFLGFLGLLLTVAIGGGLMLVDNLQSKVKL